MTTTPGRDAPPPEPADSTAWISQLVELAGRALQAGDPVERAGLVAQLQRVSGWVLRSAVSEVREAGISWRELADHVHIPFGTLHRQFQAGGGLQLVRPGTDSEPPALEPGSEPAQQVLEPRELSGRPEPRVEPPAAGLGSAQPTPEDRSPQRPEGATALPSPVDSFVGRERELQRTSRLLTRSRLLTVTGPAGAGKTRLSLEVARRVEHTFDDGVWFVELAAVSEPALVTQTLAAAVGVRERLGESLIETVIATLRAKRALIVVDNCEHLVQACADVLSELLRRCPRLRVLATSREALQVAGEVLVTLFPLPLPTAEGAADRATLLRSDAVRLFLDRAAASAPGFELTDANGRAIAEICVRLDGLPLAIELATRRLRTLSPDQLLEYLDDRLQLLAMPGRAAVGRQHSLRAAIEWSHDLLGERERAVFRRLALLAGGFDVDTAVAVCADNRLGRVSVVDALVSLEAKSLLVAAGGGWLRQLESVRLFAREQLAAAGDLDDSYDRLVAHMAGFLEPLVTNLTVRTETWDAIHGVQGSMLPAIEWAIDAGDPRQVLIGVSLAKMWRRQGYPTQAGRLVDRVLAFPSALPAHRALCLCEAAYLAMRRREMGPARSLAEAAVAEARAQPAPMVLARALQLESLVLSESGDSATALARMQEQVALIRPTLTPVALASCLNNLAWVALEAGEPDAAEGPLAEALALHERYGEPSDRMEVLHTSGTLALFRGALDEAEEFYCSALRTPSEDVEDPAFHLEGVAIVAARRGEFERALRLVGAGRALRVRVGLENEPWWQGLVDAAAADASAALPPSRARLALDGGSRYTTEQARAYALRTHDTEPVSEAVLTPRERQVAELVAEGMTNGQIARKLNIAERTAVSHLERIRAKLGVSSRVQIAIYMAEQKG